MTQTYHKSSPSSRFWLWLTHWCMYWGGSLNGGWTGKAWRRYLNAWKKANAVPQETHSGIFAALVERTYSQDAPSRPMREEEAL